MKYEIWLLGGPAPEFQSLFAAGTSLCLRDRETLLNLPKGELQLVITTQPREYSEYDSDEESGMYSSSDVD